MTLNEAKSIRSKFISGQVLLIASPVASSTTLLSTGLLSENENVIFTATETEQPSAEENLMSCSKSSLLEVESKPDKTISF